MRIKIIGATKEHMQVMGIEEYPFTAEELRDKFRELTKKHHPDVSKEGGSHQKMVKINGAYSYLKALCITEDNNASVEEVLGKVDEDDLFDRIYSEHCGYCAGRGYNHKYRSGWVCPKCSNLFNMLAGGGNGVVALKCRDCDNGVFTLRSGRKVDCRKCSGTGYFKATCNLCYGNYRKESASSKVTCHKCKGKGRIKVEPFNPVIPKGAVL